MVNLSNIATASPWQSFCVAMMMGVTHVVLGPDHVSALVMLVAGVKRREQQLETRNNFKSVWRKSALQGFRWGVGHTLGLGFMTGIFMSFRSSIPMEKIATASDYIVGSMMLMIGSASLVSLYKWRKKEEKRLAHLQEINAVEEGGSALHPKDGLPIEVVPGSEAHNEAHEHHMTHTHGEGETETKSLWEKFKQWRMGDTFTDSPTSAYVVGTIHGISGLSGIVYVLPALFLNDTGRLLLYLLGFTITSIGSMSGVAAVMGLVPQGTKKLMILNGVAGTTVISVGIIWIVLTSMGKLDL